MDTKEIGRFLAQLRKENGLTQEALGVCLGVTNKTVSRWENGNYMPPVDILKSLSALYGVSINEILSAQRLDADAYQPRAEENIAEVMQKGNYTSRERRRAMGEWLREKWWAVALCLAPAVVGYSLLPVTVGPVGAAVLDTTFVLAVGILILCHHAIFYVARRAYAVTKADAEFRVSRILRSLWLILLGISLFVSIDIGLATLYAMTPAGTADGYGIRSLFYDILIEDHGNYLDQCWIVLRRVLWQTFAASLICIDLAILWMKRCA